MKTLSVILIALLAIPASWRAEKLTGYVSDENGNKLENVQVRAKGMNLVVYTDNKGYYELNSDKLNTILVFRKTGFLPQEIRVSQLRNDVVLIRDPEKLHITETPDHSEMDIDLDLKIMEEEVLNEAFAIAPSSHKMSMGQLHESNTEEYAEIREEGYLSPNKHPLSTFSIDVDAASYANVRRYLNNGQQPPADAVRIEEMVNYFNYTYEAPKGEMPFSITTEVIESPWNNGHKLVHIGLQGVKIEMEDLPPANLVFLLDVSGSMNSPDKLPLLKSSLKMLTNQLREEDRVSIVVYAGAAGVVLEPTSGKAEIIGALERLNAGGSTAGGAGIELAYQLAEREFDPEKNNRVILATDGDFNVGLSDVTELERLIEKKRTSGIYLTVLGFGTGNLKDNRMETLADKGNGNYSYIDSILEAKKVLVEEMGGTLLTIARDVKIQVEFNPANVQAYRLIGYENRRLNDEDFNDDSKDAGELGAGHSVTALYEIIPAGVKSEAYSIDPLKYQTNISVEEKLGDELLTVKLRYKMPKKTKSRLITQVVANESVELQEASENMRWSAVVAGFGMYLRNSPYLGSEFELTRNIEMAKSARGKDLNGYRAEFIRLMEVQENL